MLPSDNNYSAIRAVLKGATEIAGLDSDGLLVWQGWTLHDWTMTDD